MDANVSMLTDHVHVGEAVMRKAHTVTNAERAASLQHFLLDTQLRLINTFVDPKSQLCIRANWNGQGASQIDFLAVSFSLAVEEVAVDQFLSFATDHKLIWGTVLNSKPARYELKRSALRNSE